MRKTLTAWLKQSVYACIAKEAATRAPLETGGVLLGYCSQDGDDAVITHSIGPGPHAVHERFGFTPDQEFHIAEIARMYTTSGRRLAYLGDWHTHPGGSARLSPRDLKTLKSIAMHKHARAPRPIMLVLAPGPHWEPSAWRATITRSPAWHRSIDIEALRVHLFESSTDT
jgi:integrative and conjugative element protein (TIGR02256 family)